MNTKQIYLPDGRMAQQVTHEIQEGEQTRVVTETHEEPPKTLQLKQRVVEYKQPMVIKREIETINEAGEIVDKTTESLLPEPTLTVRDHITTNNQVEALAVDPCYVTQQDLADTLTLTLSSLVDALRPQQPQPKQPTEAKVQALALPANKTDWMSDKTVNLVLWSCIAAGVAAFAWICFS